MRNVLQFLLWGLTLSLASACSEGTLPDPAPASEVRVATFNTHHFGRNNAKHPDGKDAKTILEDVSAVQAAHDPDIWLFQEVFRSLDPNPNDFVTDHLARLLEALPGFQAIYHPENIKHDRFYKGNALFWHHDRFEPIGDAIKIDLESGGRVNDSKGAIGQLLRRLDDGRPLLVVDIHLDAGVSSKNRGQQMAEALQAIDAHLRSNESLEEVGLSPDDLEELPRIVGGDLNSVYGFDEPSIVTLEGAGYQEAFDHFVRTQDLGFMLDHIFARGLEPLGALVARDARHSDHFPVIGSFDLPLE